MTWYKPWTWFPVTSDKASFEVPGRGPGDFDRVYHIHRDCDGEHQLGQTTVLTGGVDVENVEYPIEHYLCAGNWDAFSDDEAFVLCLYEIIRVEIHELSHKYEEEISLHPSHQEDWQAVLKPLVDDYYECSQVPYDVGIQYGV